MDCADDGVGKCGNNLANRTTTLRGLSLTPQKPPPYPRPQWISAMKFEDQSAAYLRLFNDFLQTHSKQFRASISQRFVPLIDAMDYSLQGGGKRLRPLLMMSSAECLGINPHEILPAACALEYIHTYSLVHDDLPAIDDDDERRGRPSNHKKFGEAIAVLCGDALLTEAFGLMVSLSSNPRFEANKVLSAIDLLVHCAGVRGMVGGQLLDVTTEHPNYNLPEVEFIHIHKTGALIVAAVTLPSRLLVLDAEMVQRLRRFAEAVGLAFQISDDILDSEPAARYARGPRKKPKPSYTQLMSPADMRHKLNSLIDTATASLEGLGNRAEPLRQIAEFIRVRKH